MFNPVVIDNYDSFTYNLVYYIRTLTDLHVPVFRNDEIDGSSLGAYSHILLSPGPGIPDEAGNLKDIIRFHSKRAVILGVCLGHQAIAEIYGATLKQMEQVVHGKKTSVHLRTDNPLFKGVPDTIQAGRYHSWVVNSNDFPEDLEIIGEDAGHNIMALRHKKLQVYGVQFHPESIMTPMGKHIINNWLQIKR